MIEKVNPKHPDKIADRIAGAIVDLVYMKEEKPRIAVEVLIGHNNCKIIIESSIIIEEREIFNTVYRIVETEDIRVEVIYARQDEKLAENQKGKLRSGDNGIFRGVPVTDEQRVLSKIANLLYEKYNSDGKYIYDEKESKLIICQSNAKNEDIVNLLRDNNYEFKNLIINPLGEWTGGLNVDTGATNRKLGSDMADSITGRRFTR